MGKASQARMDATARYELKVYDKYLVRVPKGSKALIEHAASDAGESLNAYTNRAILNRMGLNDWPAKEEKTDA